MMLTCMQPGGVSQRCSYGGDMCECPRVGPPIREHDNNHCAMQGKEIHFMLGLRSKLAVSRQLLFMECRLDSVSHGTANRLDYA